jgi:hypothetical protein
MFESIVSKLAKVVANTVRAIGAFFAKTHWIVPAMVVFGVALFA